jgi:hypothetical protein
MRLPVSAKTTLNDRATRQLQAEPEAASGACRSVHVYLFGQHCIRCCCCDTRGGGFCWPAGCWKRCRTTSPKCARALATWREARAAFEGQHRSCRSRAVGQISEAEMTPRNSTNHEQPSFRWEIKPSYVDRDWRLNTSVRLRTRTRVDVHGLSLVCEHSTSLTLTVTSEEEEEDPEDRDDTEEEDQAVGGSGVTSGPV